MTGCTVNGESSTSGDWLIIDEKVVEDSGHVRSRYVVACDCRYVNVLAKLTVAITSTVINNMRSFISQYLLEMFLRLQCSQRSRATGAFRAAGADLHALSDCSET